MAQNDGSESGDAHANFSQFRQSVSPIRTFVCRPAGKLHFGFVFLPVLIFLAARRSNSRPTAL
jgi:hypothetical protein